MATSSSSSSEMQGEGGHHHPYMGPDAESPVGAFEARQVKNGFYVRVDMPGVPSNGVKIYKYGDSKTVTFNGKAPKLWMFDSFEERVYGGYVVLDVDPNKVDVDIILKNGSLRLFFCGAQGSLHFFPGRKDDQGSTSKIYYPCEDSSDDEQSDPQPNITLDHVIGFIPHNLDCSCKCKGKKEFILVITPKSEYMNPFVLKGGKGVCESKLVHKEITGKHLYLRLDMPGVPDKGSILAVNPDIKTVVGEDSKVKYYMIIGGNGPKEHRFDKEIRSYLCCVALQCNCCEIDSVTQSFKDGVFRILFRKIKKKNTEETTPQSSSLFKAGKEFKINIKY